MKRLTHVNAAFALAATVTGLSTGVAAADDTGTPNPSAPSSSKQSADASTKPSPSGTTSSTSGKAGATAQGKHADVSDDPPTTPNPSPSPSASGSGDPKPSSPSTSTSPTSPKHREDPTAPSKQAPSKDPGGASPVIPGIQNPVARTPNPGAVAVSSQERASEVGKWAGTLQSVGRPGVTVKPDTKPAKKQAQASSLPSTGADSLTTGVVAASFLVVGGGLLAYRRRFN
jgi:peptidase M23